MKVFTVFNTFAHGQRTLVCLERVRSRSFRAARNQNVASAHFFLLPLPSLLHQVLQEVIIGQIRTCQLGSITGQFPLECLNGIHAQRLRSLDFQLEIDEQFHVFVERGFCYDAVSVVFQKHMLEISCVDFFGANRENGS